MTFASIGYIIQAPNQPVCQGEDRIIDLLTRSRALSRLCYRDVRGMRRWGREERKGRDERGREEEEDPGQIEVGRLREEHSEGIVEGGE